MDILENIEKANEDLKAFDIKIPLVLIGGAAFIINKLINRSTHDIDFINTIDKDAWPILNKYSINNRAVMHISNFGDWDNDKMLIKEYSNIILYTLSNERLLASRMFNRKRYEDLERSFENQGITIDKNKFEDILEELIEVNQPTYNNEFKENIYLIDELYDKRGWNEKKRIKRISKRIT